MLTDRTPQAKTAMTVGLGVAGIATVGMAIFYMRKLFNKNAEYATVLDDIEEL